MTETPDHPNAVPLELMPPDWWIFTIRELHRNENEDLQIALESLSSAFAAKYMVILTRGLAHNHIRIKNQVAGMGKTINEAFRHALQKISEKN